MPEENYNAASTLTTAVEAAVGIAIANVYKGLIESGVSPSEASRQILDSPVYSGAAKIFGPNGSHGHTNAARLIDLP